MWLWYPQANTLPSATGRAETLTKRRRYPGSAVCPQVSCLPSLPSADGSADTLHTPAVAYRTQKRWRLRSIGPRIKRKKTRVLPYCRRGPKKLDAYTTPKKGPYPPYSGDLCPKHVLQLVIVAEGVVTPRALHPRYGKSYLELVWATWLQRGQGYALLTRPAYHMQVVLHKKRLHDAPTAAAYLRHHALHADKQKVKSVHFRAKASQGADLGHDHAQRSLDNSKRHRRLRT